MFLRVDIDHFESKFKNSDDNLGDRWGHRWRGSQKFRHDLYISMLKEILPFTNKGIILDIGCGLGELTKKVKELDKKNWVIGMEISRAATARGKCLLKNSSIDMIIGALPFLPFRGDSVNLVICAEVLYYLNPKFHRLSLQNIQEILKRSGFLVLSVLLGRGIKTSLRFTEKEIINLVSMYFHVKRIEYNYAKLYNILEKPLLLLCESVNFAEKIQKMSDNDFKKWTAKVSRRTVRLAKIIRKFGYVILPISKSIIPKIRFLLSLKAPVVASYKLTKLLMGRKGRTHAIFLLKNNIRM